MIVIKRNSFSRATERGDSANHHPHNATMTSAAPIVASANPANRTSSMSRIFGTDISNITNAIMGRINPTSNTAADANQHL